MSDLATFIATFLWTAFVVSNSLQVISFNCDSKGHLLKNVATRQIYIKLAGSFMVILSYLLLFFTRLEIFIYPFFLGFLLQIIGMFFPITYPPDYRR